MTDPVAWAARQPDGALRAAVRRARRFRTLPTALPGVERMRAHGEAAYVELCDRAVGALVCAAAAPPAWAVDALGPLPPASPAAADWWEAACLLAAERAVRRSG